MNDSYARFCNSLYYLIGVVIGWIGIALNSDMGKTERIILAIILLIVGLLPSFFYTNNLFDFYKYKRGFLMAYVIMSFVIYLSWNSITLFFCAFFLMSMLCLIYLDEEFHTFQKYVCIISLALMFFYEHASGNVTMNEIDFLIVFFMFLGINYIGKQIIKLILFERFKSLEQERSLDDMLRVVESKVDEARDAAKSKSEFLSNMSHEIRTPINAVLGMNEMISRESDDEQISEYSRNIASSGNMLLALINDILDLSKIESGKVAIIRVEYQLSTVCNDLMNMIKERAGKKDLGLKLKINPQIPNYLYGDEVRIRQIILNLLTNAVKYTDEGTITLNVDFVQRTKGQIDLSFSVKDTGRGIKKQDKDKLFNSFMRLEEAKNKNIEGTGLGLAIVGGYVKLMHGKIDVISDYGKGSEFIVTIPQKVVKHDEIGEFDFKFNKPAAKKNAYKPSFKASKAKILAVDDNNMNLLVVKNLLKSTQIRIDFAHGGHECIDKVSNEFYDVILLDHMMPEMDGTECLKYMKDNDLIKNTPVIALTANALSGAKEEYIKLGFNDYLSKPIVPLELENMLRHWLPGWLIENNVE